MRKLPKSDNSLLLRTDFSDNKAWSSLCAAVQVPSDEGFLARLDCVSDRAYDGLTVEQLVALAPKGGDHTFAFVADRVALTSPEQPVLVVDLNDEPGRTFRVVPRELWGVENNLSIANMDYCEFADSTDADGVFRGFPPTPSRATPNQPQARSTTDSSAIAPPASKRTSSTRSHDARQNMTKRPLEPEQWAGGIYALMVVLPTIILSKEAQPEVVLSLRYSVWAAIPVLGGLAAGWILRRRWGLAMVGGISGYTGAWCAATWCAGSRATSIYEALIATGVGALPVFVVYGLYKRFTKPSHDVHSTR